MTRVKVYRTPAEMQTDVKAAAIHGWTVESEDTQADGTRRVTFTQGWDAAPSAQDYQRAMSKALEDDRRKAEMERALGAVLSLIVLGVIVWWLFGQPTLEDIQTKSIEQLLQGWRFPA